MDDSFQLARFVEAQDNGGTYDRALAELRRGHKTGHWIWFVFPQLEGLGRSAMAQHYAIGSLAEAQAYVAHPVLGARLRECAQVLADTAADIRDVLGDIDAIKLRSSMTLFHLADPSDAVFSSVLDRHFAGRLDNATQEKLP